jgi:teichuronic acid biosynthesis glycosyltransferase TuaC
VRHLVLTTSYPRESGDPSGHFVLAEVNALRRAGHHMRVVAAGAGARATGSGVQLRWLGGSALFGWPGALTKLRENPWAAREIPLVLGRAALELWRHSGPVTAHWLLPFGVLAALLWRSGRHQELTIYCHGSDVRLFGRLPRFIRRWLTRSLAQAEPKLVVVSEALAAELGEHLGKAAVGSWRIEVRPALIHVEAPSGGQAEARRRLQVGQEPLIVCVGRLTKDKRTDVALSASQLVPRAQVVCIGDGPSLETLRQQFPEVRFLGRLPRPDTLTWIQAADLLVTASRDEGAPSVVREALLLGTDAVMHDIADAAKWAESNPLLHIA